MTLEIFEERYWGKEHKRADDERGPYKRDYSRIVHSAGFRRLQAKTQVMGVGEGDFHRTRLTHSIEVAQIGEGILDYLRRIKHVTPFTEEWLPSRELVLAACYAHDLGHPPFGHGGELALHAKMLNYGGFEGNAQTLIILTKLEKYLTHRGINPTRRLVLAVLKYPKRYTSFPKSARFPKPPKCYFDTEKEIVAWALDPFSRAERKKFTSEINSDGKPSHRTLDCSLMECADDIAYGVHDLEDIVARRIVKESEVMDRLKAAFPNKNSRIGPANKGVILADFSKHLFRGDSCTRKSLIGRLVNLFVTSTHVVDLEGFDHPLLRKRVRVELEIDVLLEVLKNITFPLVISKAEVQQLERRGQRIVAALFEEIAKKPEHLIPKEAWNGFDTNEKTERKICDYISGMTDPYAERIYRRLFVPGFGSSHDEL